MSSTPLVGIDGLPVVLVGTSFGVDFNPAADAIRIVSDADQNLRVLPSDRAAGVIGTTFVDGAINPGGAAVTAVAYTNNDNDAATATTLYDVSSATDGLFVQNPPNAGTLVAVGAGLGLPVGEKAGFDIYTEGGANVALGLPRRPRPHHDLGPEPGDGGRQPGLDHAGRDEARRGGHRGRSPAVTR